MTISDIDECVVMKNGVIKVSFISQRKKEAVMAKKNKLKHYKDAMIYVNHDLPYDTRQEFKEKRSKEANTEGHTNFKNITDPSGLKRPSNKKKQQNLHSPTEHSERRPQTSKHKKGRHPKGARTAPLRKK